MITVTDEALAILRAMLGRAKAAASLDGSPEQRCLRVIYRGKVLGVDLDAPREGDQIVDHDGRPLLVLGQELDAALDGATIGTRRAAGGDKLVLSRRRAS